MVCVQFLHFSDRSLICYDFFWNFAPHFKTDFVIAPTSHTNLFSDIEWFVNLQFANIFISHAPFSKVPCSETDLRAKWENTCQSNKWSAKDSDSHTNHFPTRNSCFRRARFRNISLKRTGYTRRRVIPCRKQISVRNGNNDEICFTSMGKTFEKS